MPKKMRRGAVLSALASKAAGGSVKVIERIELAEISTKTLRRLLDAVGLNGKTMLVMSARDEKVALSARNLPDVRIRVLPGLSTYEVVQVEQILVTRDALEKMQEIYAP
jgi:large subunit ribosomal protein L4